MKKTKMSFRKSLVVISLVLVIASCAKRRGDYIVSRDGDTVDCRDWSHLEDSLREELDAHAWLYGNNFKEYQMLGITEVDRDSVIRKYGIPTRNYDSFKIYHRSSGDPLFGLFEEDAAIFWALKNPQDTLWVFSDRWDNRPGGNLLVVWYKKMCDRNIVIYAYEYNPKTVEF